jgi:PAS domain S-box-containing protein
MSSSSGDASSQEPRRPRGRPRRDPATPPGDPGLLGGREAESFSHAILDSLPAHLAVIENDGRVIALNKAWERFTRDHAARFPRAIRMGDNYLDALQEGRAFESSRASEVMKGLQAVLDRTRARFEIDYPIESGGADRWFQVTIVPLLGAAGGAVLSHREISDMKLAERAASEQTQMLRAVIDSTADGVVVADEAGRFVLSNRASREIAGVGILDSDPAAWDKNFGLFRPDRVTPFRLEELPLSLAIAGTSTNDVRMFVKNPAVPEGRMITVSGRPWRTPSGDRSGGVVVFRDITADVVFEERSRISADVLDAVPNAVLTLDADGIIQYWNRAAEVLCGWSAVEVVGRRGRDVLLGDEDRDKVDEIRSYLLVKGVYRGEFRVRRPDGSTVPVLALATALQRSGGELAGFVVVAVDMTDIHMTQDALRAKEYELRQYQKMEAVGRLAGGVAHDFNNLLTVIRGYMDLVLSRMPPGQPGRAEAEQVSRAAERASQLTGQLLAFGRRQALQPTMLNLNTLIADIMPMLRRTLDENVELRTKLDPELGEARGDATQLTQVLLNLVLNARDAMPNGGEILIATGNAELDAARPGSGEPLEPGPYVYFAVSDSGVGMDDETRARVFEPFFTTKDVGQGTGLGLSTCYGIVRQLGGQILLYSEPGRGTTMKVSLPRVFDTDAAIPSAELSDAPGGTETILLVEDDAEVRLIERRLLEMLGYSVLEAPNGDAALGVARTFPGKIDVLVADVVMPGRSGREVAEAVRNLRPETRVLYVSGHTGDFVKRREGLPENAPFLQKPFSSVQLGHAIRAVLGEEKAKSV